MVKTLIISLLLTVIANCILFSQDPVIQWQNSIGGSLTDNIVSTKFTPDGGVIIAGYSVSPAGFDKSEGIIGGVANMEDFWIVKLDATGNILWENTIGGNEHDILTSMDLTADGGYIIGGYTNSHISGDKTEDRFTGGTNGYDYWVLKLDASGNIVWQNDIGGTKDDYLKCIISTTDGGYLLGGYSYSQISGDKTEAAFGTTTSDYWVIKLNSTGGIVWQNDIGGTGNDQVTALAECNDGGYFIGGVSKSTITGDKTENVVYSFYNDYWIIKINSTGGIVWQNDIGGYNDDIVYDIDATADGGCIVTGASESNTALEKTENNIDDTHDDDFWLVKLSASGAIEKQNTIGTSRWEVPRSLEVVDDGYYVAGYSAGDKEFDHTDTILGFDCYWIMKLNPDLNIIWQYSVGGASTNQCRSMDINPAGELIVGGYSNSGIAGDKTEASNGGYDYWVLKLAAETCTPVPLYTDHDSDEFGTDDGIIYWDACENTNIQSIVLGDCDDMFDYILPGGTEFCNGFDDDCSGIADDGLTDCYPGPAILDQNTIGGQSGDYLQSMSLCTDGGAIMTGYSYSDASFDKSESTDDFYDYWVVKVNAGLDVEWENTISGNTFDRPYKTFQMNDGNYFVGGESNSAVGLDKTVPSIGPNTDYDFWIQYLNNTGNIIWQKAYGGSKSDRLRTAIQCNDGGFLLGGNSNSPLGYDKSESSVIFSNDDYWIIKTDAAGNKEWDNTIGGSGTEDLYELIQTNDGGFILCGGSNSGISGDKTQAARGPNNDYWIVKIDNAGVVQWNKTIGGTGSDTPKSIRQTPDGAYIVFGESASPVGFEKSEASGADYDFWIVKIDASGNLIWDKTIATTGYEDAGSMFMDPYGNFIITGTSNAPAGGIKTESSVANGESDIWIIKFDMDGNMIWQNTIGGDLWEDNGIIAQLPDYSYILGATSASHNYYDKTEDSKYTSPYGGSSDFWAMKLASDCIEISELCNSVDDNCNGLIDDAVVETINISAGGATTFCQGGSVLLSATYSGASIQWKKNGSNIAGATSSTYSVNKSGNYSAVTTSPCGTATSSVISVTVNKNPNASISAGGATTFCAGGSVTLTEIPVTGCTYQWYKGASIIAGATSTNYIATTAGNYKCRVTKTATGCYKNSNTISVTVPCKEGDEIINVENIFSIYPNPNNGTFEISVQNLASAKSPLGGNRGLFVYNSLGQLIYSEDLFSSTQTISLENISSGIYFVRVGDGNNFLEEKLIIQ